MFKPFATALIVTVSTAFGTEADAAEFNFTAFVNYTDDFTLDPLPQLGIAPGDTLTGSFSYDPNAPARYSSEREGGSYTSYQPPRGLTTPSIGQISFNFGPTPTTLQIAAIEISDNTNFLSQSVIEDGFRVVADSSPIFPAPITGDDRGYTQAISLIYLSGSDTVFDSSALPTTLNLDDFLRENRLTFSGSNDATGVREGFTATFTSLTDVTTVDTPLSGLLLASGCMMLWVRRKPRAKQA